MTSKRKNSPVAALVALVFAVVAVLLFDWTGLICYVAGFLVGSVGTAVNAERRLKASGIIPPWRYE
jgi:hypothetical protein